MTAANPPEIDVALSKQGHQSKNEIIFGEGHRMTAANPPDVDLTLSTQGALLQACSHLLRRRPNDSCKPP